MAILKEGAGWIFWLICFAIVCGPAIYVCRLIILESASILVPITLGVTLAAIVSGLISIGVNNLIHKRIERANKKRKKEKKRKKSNR